jgi:hypothetical protein
MQKDRTRPLARSAKLRISGLLRKQGFFCSMRLCYRLGTFHHFFQRFMMSFSSTIPPLAPLLPHNDASDLSLLALA